SIVEDALAGNDAALLVVEGAGVVLEVLHKRAGLGALEQHLGLTFIDLSASRHRVLLSVLWGSGEAVVLPANMVIAGNGSNVDRHPATVRQGVGSGCQAAKRKTGRRSAVAMAGNATIALDTVP